MTKAEKKILAGCASKLNYHRPTYRALPDHVQKAIASVTETLEILSGKKKAD